MYASVFLFSTFCVNRYYKNLTFKNFAFLLDLYESLMYNIYCCKDYLLYT